MPNATQMLRQDHKKVKALFTKFEQGKTGTAKRSAADQAMNELEVHAQVEEEVFYPAVRKAIESSELVDEAKNEHQEAKSLISQLKKSSKQDDGEGSDFEAEVFRTHASHPASCRGRGRRDVSPSRRQRAGSVGLRHADG